jgi:aspartate racemase
VRTVSLMRVRTSSSARTTPHTKLWNWPDPRSPLPGLHIAEVVADEAAGNGSQRVGILGTRYLMDSSVYPHALAARGITAVVPREPERLAVNSIIFDQLLDGIFGDASRLELSKIISGLADWGCDAVALVCTEIPLLIAPTDSVLPTLDSTRLIAAAAFDVAVGRRPLPSWRGGPVHPAI